jgi:hypothetical protein
LQVLEHRHHISRLADIDQSADRAVDQLVLVPIKVARGQEIAHTVPGAVVEQQPAEHARFGLDRMRRDAQLGDLLIGAIAVVVFGCKGRHEIPEQQAHGSATAFAVRWTSLWIRGELNGGNAETNKSGSDPDFPEPPLFLRANKSRP